MCISSKCLEKYGNFLNNNNNNNIKKNLNLHELDFGKPEKNLLLLSLSNLWVKKWKIVFSFSTLLKSIIHL